MIYGPLCKPALMPAHLAYYFRISNSGMRYFILATYNCPVLEFQQDYGFAKETEHHMLLSNNSQKYIVKRGEAPKYP